jgi:hypothetical protein
MRPPASTTRHHHHRSTPSRHCSNEVAGQHQVSPALSSLFRQCALLTLPCLSQFLITWFFVEGLYLLWTIEFRLETSPTLKTHLYPDVRGVWRDEEKVCDQIPLRDVTNTLINVMYIYF